MSLNENSKNIPYTLGRLFSVYEEIQKEANLRNPGNPGINTTIKERYFGSAAAMPAFLAAEGPAILRKNTCANFRMNSVYVLTKR
mgnify:CR=1 FL=1